MIYTVGAKDVYDEYIKNDPNPRKRGRNSAEGGQGGSVFKSIDAARNCASMASCAQGREFVVYGVLADWNRDCDVGKGDWAELLVNSKLVFLDDPKKDLVDGNQSTNQESK